MAEGRSVAAWWHTAAVLALLANQHRDPKKRRRPYEAAEFHPHFAEQARRRDGMPITRDNIGALKALLPKKKRK